MKAITFSGISCVGRLVPRHEISLAITDSLPAKLSPRDCIDLDQSSIDVWTKAYPGYPRDCLSKALSVKTSSQGLIGIQEIAEG